MKLFGKELTIEQVIGMARIGDADPRCRDECLLHSIVSELADYAEKMLKERDNPPLTLEELRGMDGEPVWAGNEKEPEQFQWFIVNCTGAYKPFILLNCNNNLMWQYIKSAAHPGGWTAYRRPPEKGE